MTLSERKTQYKKSQSWHLILLFYTSKTMIYILPGQHDQKILLLAFGGVLTSKDNPEHLLRTTAEPKAFCQL